MGTGRHQDGSRGRQLNAVSHSLVLSTRAVSAADARDFESYAYPAPYDLYDSAPGSMQEVLDPGHRYISVVDREGCLWGFGCTGSAGEVPGGTYGIWEGGLDVGVGMSPDRVGRGFGRAFALAVLDHALTPDLDCFRVSVAAFNERSLRLWRSLAAAVDFA